MTCRNVRTIQSSVRVARSTAISAGIMHVYAWWRWWCLSQWIDMPRNDIPLIDAILFRSVLISWGAQGVAADASSHDRGLYTTVSLEERIKLTWPETTDISGIHQKNQCIEATHQLYFHCLNAPPIRRRHGWKSQNLQESSTAVHYTRPSKFIRRYPATMIANKTSLNLN